MKREYILVQWKLIYGNRFHVTATLLSSCTKADNNQAHEFGEYLQDIIVRNDRRAFLSAHVSRNAALMGMMLVMFSDRIVALALLGIFWKIQKLR